MSKKIDWRELWERQEQKTVVETLEWAERAYRELERKYKTLQWVYALSIVSFLVVILIYLL